MQLVDKIKYCDTIKCGEHMDNILTSQTLWENFDPTAEELDINLIKQTGHRGNVTKQLYFTGRTLPSGAKTRVFAEVCYCDKSEGKPAVLLVGDFSRPIEEKVLLDLAKRGFVAMSVDFAGRRDNGLFTIYPEEIIYCNNAFAKSMFDIDDTARETKMYEYALNCRRALTYLLDVEKVSQASVLTYGKGVYVGIIALGTETRLKNGAILFGNLYRNFPAPGKDEDMMGDDEDELARHIAYDTRRQQWTLGLAPQTYAQQIKVPLYVVNSANSPYVDVMQTSRSMARINHDSRLLVLPTSMDYIPKRYVGSVTRWLLGYEAKPKSELKSFRNGAGDYCVRITTDHPLAQTSLWYCTDADQRARHWTKATLNATEDGYVAKLTLFEKDCTVASFAIFDDDVAISTPLLTEKVTAVNVTKALNIIFSGTGKQVLIPITRYGDWWNIDLEPRLEKGYLNIVGAEGRALATFAINDKSIRINPAFTVVFDVCCNVRQQLYLYALTKFGSANTYYSQSVQILGNGKWERVSFDKVNFKRTDDGKQLADTEKVDMLVIYAENEFLVNNIFLV